MSIPNINRTNEVSTDRRGCPERTVENWGEEVSGEIELFCNVYRVCDLWSIRIIGPRLWPGVGHDPGMYPDEGFRWRAGSKVGRGAIPEMEKALLDSGGGER